MWKRVWFGVVGLGYAFAAMAQDSCRNLIDDPRVLSTRAHYGREAANYANKHDRVSPNFSAVRERFLAHLPAGGSVLDVGAAAGRDTRHFLERGFTVTALEPVAEFVTMLNGIAGVRVLPRMVEELDGRGVYDGIWASAALIHVPVERLPDVFRRLSTALKPGGVIAASFCMGVGTPDRGEIEPKGRYFSRVTEATLRRIVAEVRELELIERETDYQTDDYHGPNKPTDTFHFFNLTLKLKAPRH